MQEGFGCFNPQGNAAESQHRQPGMGRTCSIFTETQNLWVQGTFQIMLVRAVTGTLPPDQATQA